MPTWTAATVADELGINRTRDGDLREMVKALGLLPWLNSEEDRRRKSAAEWALAHWKAYQAECTSRRDRRSRERPRKQYRR